MSWKGHSIRFYRQQPQHYNFVLSSCNRRKQSLKLVHSTMHTFIFCEIICQYGSNENAISSSSIVMNWLRELSSKHETQWNGFMSWNGHSICFYKQQSQHNSCVLSNFQLRRKPKPWSGRSNNEPIPNFPWNNISRQVKCECHFMFKHWNDENS